MASNTDLGGHLFILSILLFILSLAIFYDAIKRYLLLQKITNTPTSKVEAAAIGLSEFTGVSGYGDKPLTSPVSRSDCVFWKLDFFAYESGKYGGRWSYVLSSNSNERFRIKDETGSIKVDPTGTRSEITAMNEYFGSISGFIGAGPFRRSQNQLPPEAIEYISNALDPAPRKRLDYLKDSQFKVVESFIPSDQPTYVLGSVMQSIGAGSPDKSEMVYVGKNSLDNTLFISDSDEKKLVDEIRGAWRKGLYIGLGMLAVSLILILIIMFVPG